MRTPLIFLKAIGKAVLNALGGGVLGDIVIDALPEIANNVWESWSRDKDAVQRRAELEAVAQATGEELREGIAEVIREIAPEQPAEVRQALTGYLQEVPATVRRVLRRPDDPAGATVPAGLALRKGEDLLPFLPARLPRFKPGDQPLPGVDWVLEELLGVGGFGEVWKAHNPHVEGFEPVALKFCIDFQARQRLLTHEAKIVAQVLRQGRHPGIVALQRTYLSADPPCLEYEYVEGGDLAGLIQDWHRQENKPTPDQAARVVLRLAEIIGFAHRLNPPIVHRDLKPSNILVTRVAGEVRFKIADFGIGGVAVAGAVAATRRPTSAGVLMTSVARGSHTPSYASPEQMRGGEPNPRDDVHALGVIWYQILTGDLARGRPSGRGWRSRQGVQGMGADQLDLLESCFEEDPIDRPRDAAELAERLEKLLTPRPSQKEPTPPPPPEPDPPAPGLTAKQYVDQGNAWFGKQEYDKAIADQSEAIRLDPKYAFVHWCRGEVWYNKKEYDKAIADYSEAIRLDSKYALAYRNRGVAWHHKMKYDKAIADYNEAIRLDPKDADAYRNRALAYDALGKSVEAREDRAIADHLDEPGKSKPSFFQRWFG